MYNELNSFYKIKPVDDETDSLKRWKCDNNNFLLGMLKKHFLCVPILIFYLHIFIFKRSSSHSYWVSCILICTEISCLIFFVCLFDFLCVYASVTSSVRSFSLSLSLFLALGANAKLRNDVLFLKWKRYRNEVKCQSGGRRRIIFYCNISRLCGMRNDNLRLRFIQLEISE